MVRNQQTLGEILPSYARSLQFKFTARDNRLNGGGVGNNDTPVTLTVINTGSAFSVTSPNTNVNWTGLSSQTVTWNVSSTTASPISCANVNILLSVDSGYTFPYTLVSNTPNDGSQTVSIPNIAGNKNRIKVESVGNIFFDMSDVNFTINVSSGVLTSIITNPLVSNSICAGSTFDVSFNADGVPNAGNNYTVQLSNPSGSFATGVSDIGSLLNSTLSFGTITATILAGTTAGSNYKIRVISSNPAVNGSDNGSFITISQTPATPGIISGSISVCQNQSGVTYSVPAIANATGYLWSLPAGASITSGSNTNSITVSFSSVAVSGTITVAGTNSVCGTGPSSAPLSVIVNPFPAAAGVISGPLTVCQSSTGNIYSVASIANASSYAWVLPSGASISTGAGTNSITVTYSGASVSGTLSVAGVNSCGSGVSSLLTIIVTASPVPALVSAAGPTNLCSGGNVSLSYSPSLNVLYQWRKNGINLSGETGPSYTASSAGTYDVTSVQAALAPQSFSTSTRVSIPDNSCTGASSSISVSGYSGTVSTSGISIQLNITHTYLGDLVLMLEAPNGNILGLSNRVGSSSDNYTNTVFSDAGSAQIPGTGAPYTGTYKPWTTVFNDCVQTTVTTFSAIGGGNMNPNGAWKLWAYDRAGVDTGGIVNWTINFPGSLVGTCMSTSNAISVSLIPPVVISNFTPSSGSPGTSVQISGGNFTGTSMVLFNGISASFTVDNSSQITATVPPGATSGLITVTGTCGNVNSLSPFTVLSADISLHLTVLVEGFYRGAGLMTGVLSASECDTVEVILADPSNPHSFLYSSKGTIDLSGTGDFVFQGAGQNEYYYIVVKHRNSLEIWSADSVSFSNPAVSYDFTDASGKAYGGNQTLVGVGKYAMYSGDVNQDGFIDNVDLIQMENGLVQFLFGYYSEDLSGDSFAEGADYALLENNLPLLLQVLKP